MQTGTTDAARLDAIHQLETAVAAKQPALATARSNLDTARGIEAERRASVAAIDIELKRFTTETLRKTGCAYLNGSSLDRGTVSLGHEQLRFAGWLGRIEIPLSAIRYIELGTSFISSRAGIPILNEFWPGVRRPSETLLITIQDTVNTLSGLVVIADVPDGTAWRGSILDQQQRLGEVATQRAELLTRRVTSSSALTDATRQREAAAEGVAAVEAQIQSLQEQRQKLNWQQQQLDLARKQAAKAEIDALRKSVKR